MHFLDLLLRRSERLVVGLMSGTSLDGVDVATARISGSGAAVNIQMEGFTHRPYPETLKSALLLNSAPDTSSVLAISQLHARLPRFYADSVRIALQKIGIPVDAVDLIGCHGQTLYHVPEPTDCAGRATTSTFQIGDPTVLANDLGIPVVGDFRTADMALGGQGAPLVPYFDYVYFTDALETRGLLNLGGIANLTLLPAGGTPDAVLAFDTGPSNMVMDILTQRFFDQPYDANGRLAADGRRIEPLLDALLADPYFQIAPPKSTGREYFGAPYVDGLIQHPEARSAHPQDLLTTAVALTARSIYQAYQRFIEPVQPMDVLIAAGGGVHNATLMHHLATDFAPIPVRTLQDYGLDPDAKEALCFAVLAHEFINGTPTNMPSVTGASRPTLLGKLCLPYRP
jgi:anhydro-N-acetylmuramic acid kinase